MPGSERKLIAGGEFTRFAATGACPWSKPTAGGPLVDGLARWLREGPALVDWLRGRVSPKLKAQASLELHAQWGASLAAAWGVAPEAPASGEPWQLGARILTLHSHWLEIALPLMAPPVKAAALEAWRMAVNRGVYLVAVTAGCGQAVVRVPPIAPTEADVETIGAALDYVAAELCPVLECLHSHHTLAAMWERWLPDAAATAGKEATEPWQRWNCAT